MRILFCVLIITCFSSTAFADNTGDVWVGREGITVYENTLKISEEGKKKYIKEWIEDGSICKIYGHRWVDMTPNWINSTAPYHPDRCRVCEFCGKEQVKASTWIDLN